MSSEPLSNLDFVNEIDLLQVDDDQLSIEVVSCGLILGIGFYTSLHDAGKVALMDSFIPGYFITKRIYRNAMGCWSFKL